MQCSQLCPVSFHCWALWLVSFHRAQGSLSGWCWALWLWSLLPLSCIRWDGLCWYDQGSLQRLRSLSWSSTQFWTDMWHLRDYNLLAISLLLTMNKHLLSRASIKLIEKWCLSPIVCKMDRCPGRVYAASGFCLDTLFVTSNATCEQQPVLVLACLSTTSAMLASYMMHVHIYAHALHSAKCNCMISAVPPKGWSDHWCRYKSLLKQLWWAIWEAKVNSMVSAKLINTYT